MRVVRQLLLDLGTAGPKKPVHWRFSLMANGLLLLLLPPQSPQEAATLARHFWPHLCNQLTSQRTWAGLFFVLLADKNLPWNSVRSRPKGCWDELPCQFGDGKVARLNKHPWEISHLGPNTRP